MSIVGGALIFAVRDYSTQSYCRINSIDEAKCEAVVIVEQNHKFKSNDAVNIQTNDEARGMLFYEGAIKEVFANKVVVKSFALINENQRRSDVRIRVNVTLILDGILVGNNIQDIGQGIAVQCVDLSAGGIMLKTIVDLAEENACLLFDFPLGTRNLSCKAQIVRKKLVNEHYFYGCRFLNNESQKAEIRRFVFKKQLDSRKRYFHGK